MMEDSSVSDVSKDGSSLTRSPTFDRDAQIHVDGTAGSASISPCYRDVVVASREGLHIIDLDFPQTPPRHFAHYSPWEVADVQWSPFASRAHWVVSTSNQKALVWNLASRSSSSAIQHTLHGHTRAITDINFSAHDPDVLATCAVDSFVHCWDLRDVRRADKPFVTFADWNAGATQVKWNRQNSNILASSHDKFLRIWDKRRGTIPLKSIEAHHTKIYGIDWSRTEPNTLITCSLDKTIKRWDFEKESNEPEQVIHTPFPVWRARHTPFGTGILAMPQRGSNDLHLYDYESTVKTDEGYTSSVYSFKGHGDQVKEFLWRVRGGPVDGHDQRDFQLISWGLDRRLLLHRCEARHLRTVGYQKGQKADTKLTLTRAGAEYKTFRDESKITPVDDESDDDQPKGLGALVSAAGMSKAPPLFGAMANDRGFALSSRGTLSRRDNNNANPVKWLTGVKIGRKRALTIDPYHPRPSVSRTSMSEGSPQDEHEQLGDEITSVARKFKKVDFEEVEVQRGIVTVGLNGPWGPDGKLVFLRITLKFPEGYPRFVAAFFALERATSVVEDRVMDRLNQELDTLVAYYGRRHVGCLDGVVTYLLGERSLEDSMLEGDLEDSGAFEMAPVEDSSSDEEEVGAAAAGLENSGSGLLEHLPARQLPPPANTCGGFFAGNGQLICFFLQKEVKSQLNFDTAKTADRFKIPRHLESLGRLHERSPSSRQRTLPSADADDSESSSSGSLDTSSSSTESSISDEVARLPDRFNPPRMWRAATLRFQKAASRSSGGQAVRAAQNAKAKSKMIIHDVSDLLPSKLVLALDYKVFGGGPEVCEQNSRVAQAHSQFDAARAWDICAILLCDQIPLEAIEQPITKNSFLVVAQRNRLRGKSKDDGFKVKFDERRAVVQPLRTGLVRWGSHPLAQTWLIPQLFDYFEKKADIQMLAMLSCVLCEPPSSPKPPSPNSMHMNLPMTLRAPACSLPYFADAEVAFNSVQDVKTPKGTALLSSPALTSSDMPADYFSRMPVAGLAAPTAGTSWARSLHPSPGGTPYSTSGTPPGILKPSTQLNSLAGSLSTSPENARPLRKTVSQLSNALASLRPFSHGHSTSPDDRHRGSAEPEVSTSAPTTGVTWGVTTIISGSSTPSPEKQRQSSRRRSSAFTLDSGYNSTDDDDEHFELISSNNMSSHNHKTSNDKPQPKIRVQLKNQHHFEDESHPSVSFLDPTKLAQYAAYREMYAEHLSMWGLDQARAEVLKFNGLATLQPKEDVMEAIDLSLPTFAIKSAEPILTMPETTRNRPPSISLAKSAAARFLPLTSSPSSLSSSQPLTSPAIARLNPAAKIFTPGSPTAASIRSMSTITEIKQPSTPQAEAEIVGVPARSTRPPLCGICWEPALGLYVLQHTSEEGVYRTVHADCAQRSGRGYGDPKRRTMYSHEI